MRKLLTVLAGITCASCLVSGITLMAACNKEPDMSDRGNWTVSSPDGSIKSEITMDYSGGESAEVKKSEPVLWLNAGKLDDETFDEFVNMISGYEGNTVCKIVRGSKRYKMPNGVNYCRGLLAELSAFIDTEDIKFVDKT